MKRPLVPVVGAYAAGLITAHCSFLPAATVAGLGLAGFVLLCLGTMRRYRLLATLAAFCVFFAAGFASLHRCIDPCRSADDITRFISSGRINIEGVIEEPPARFPDRTRLRVRVAALHDRTETRPVTGTLQITIQQSSQDLRYGDRIRCFVSPRIPKTFANPGGFDYRRHLAYLGICATAFLPDDRGITVLRRGEGNPYRGAVERLRDTIRKCLDRLFPDDTGAVLKAMVIGEQTCISEELREYFSRLGIAHLLAISGLHVGIVAFISYSAVMFLLRRSQKLMLLCDIAKLASAASIVPVLLYCCIAGFTIPTIRAAIMVLCYLAALLLGRPQDVLNTLFVAAFLILLCMPASFFDVSFQLSFAAVFFLIVLVPAWQRIFHQQPPDPLEPYHPRMHRFIAVLRDMCLASIAAIVGTAPLVAIYFHSFSWAGLVANLIVVPLAGFVIVPAGLAGALACAAHLPLANLLFRCAGMLTDMMIRCVQYCGDIPGIAVTVAAPSWYEIALWYGLLMLSAVCLPRKRIRLFLGALLLTFAVLVPGRYMRSAESGKLTVTFLDVGAGDAALVEFPDRSTMLIDGGGSYNDQFDPGKFIIAPFLYSRGITSVDILVLTHPHRDHAGGLPYIARHFKPKELWHTGEPSDLEPALRLMAEAAQNSTATFRCSRLSPKRIIGGAQIEFFNPPDFHVTSLPRSGNDTNNNSLVIKISYGHVSFLMAADIQQDRERLLVQETAPLTATVLKVPHHGGKSSSSEQFIRAVGPQVAVVSCKQEELAPEVAEQYRAWGAQLLTTAEHGAISITTDGATYSIKTFR